MSQFHTDSIDDSASRVSGYKGKVDQVPALEVEDITQRRLEERSWQEEEELCPRVSAWESYEQDL